MKSPLFRHGPSPLLRLIFLSILSVGLMYYDHRENHSEAIRVGLNNLLYPLQLLVDTPSRLAGWAHASLSERTSLVQHNRLLAEENRNLKARQLQFETLLLENDHLRGLLNSTRRAEDNFSSARLIAVSMNPFRQNVIVDRGSRHGVLIGTPLIDEHGLMGQITQVFAFHSEAMLISDPTHATPVRVLRNGLRSIAMGVGRVDSLSLMYVPINADIVVGDTLVTSGLGGRFPPDYPVGKVTKVDRSEGSSFATVTAEPFAQLDRSRDVLLLTGNLSAPAAGAPAPSR